MSSLIIITLHRVLIEEGDNVGHRFYTITRTSEQFEKQTMMHWQWQKIAGRKDIK